MMRFLVTRPEPGASAFAAGLALRGAEAVIASLFDIRFADGPPLDLAGIDAIVATSANGVAALARRSAVRDVPLFAIGPQTAEAAKAEGFSGVRSAEGDRRALADFLARRLPGRAVLHVCGIEAPALSAPGCFIRRAALYESAAATRLPDAAAEALRAGSLAGAFFFSPRGAGVFKALAARDGLDRFCAGLDAYCISAAAAKYLTPLPFAQICIAAQPNRAAMLDMLPRKPAQ